MKLALALGLVLLAAQADAETLAVGRFQIVAAPQGTGQGSHAVFRLDTVTGKIWYCVPESTPDQPMRPVSVRCMTELK